MERCAMVTGRITAAITDKTKATYAIAAKTARSYTTLDNTMPIYAQADTQATAECTTTVCYTTMLTQASVHC